MLAIRPVVPVEGRVAEGHVEALIDADQALEYLPAIRLPAQLDGSGEAWVGGEDRSGRGQRLRVDVGADEAPAVFVVAEQRVDAVGSGSDVQRTQAGTAWNQAIVAGAEQVGQVVQVVGATGNGRAQVTIGYIPLAYVVELLQQRAVEGFHRRRIGEVDALPAVRIEDDEALQFRAAGDQARKVVASQVAIARVQRAGALALGVGMRAGRAGHVLGFRVGEAGIIHIRRRLASVSAERRAPGPVTMETATESPARRRTSPAG